MSFEHGLSAFQKHMKENVVPSTFGDLSIDEVESLILAQWNEIPEQAKQEWRDKSSSEPQIVETKPSDNASAAHSDSIDKLTTEIQEKLTIEKVEAKGKESPQKPNEEPEKPKVYIPSKEGSFKVVLVGPGGVGKTAFVKKLVTGEFQKAIEPTLGVEVTEVELETNKGIFRFKVWDCAGSAGNTGLGDGYYIIAQGAILMFSTTSKGSYKDAQDLYKGIIRVCDQIPICLVGNKADDKNQAVRSKDVTFHRRHNLDYYATSVKSGYNIQKPLLAIARRLCGDPSLQIPGLEMAAPAEVGETEQTPEPAPVLKPGWFDEMLKNSEGNTFSFGTPPATGTSSFSSESSTTFPPPSVSSSASDSSSTPRWFPTFSIPATFSFSGLTEASGTPAAGTEKKPENPSS